LLNECQQVVLAFQPNLLTLNEAVVEAENQGIKGKDATPFLLGKIVEKTNGKSLAANIKLVENNAALGLIP
jgi:pseudouridine-5'-phosphate glycosidase